jgi:hypothetical protein
VHGTYAERTDFQILAFVEQDGELPSINRKIRA